MSPIRLALANLTLSPLSSVVNSLLLALGTASIAVLLLANQQLTATLERNAAGIDLVIGAKGSPLQLVLAGIYHADVPPGNIGFEEVQKWNAHPMVNSAIPLSIGDSYQGHRIIGTTPDFVNLYDAKLKTGDLWARPFEAVIGARVARATGLEIGETFSGSHGLVSSNNRHDDTPYRIVGQFAPTQSVFDNLIITSTQSVWQMHNENGHGAGDTDHKLNPHGHDDQHEIATDKQDEHREQAHHNDHDTHHEQGDHDSHADHEAQSEHDHHEAPTSPYDKPHTPASHQQLENENEHHLDGDRQDNAEPVESGQEVTLLLVTLASPMGVLTLPRAVNAEPGLQAASPAYELTRLLQIVGIGVTWLNAFAIVLVISAALSIFAALYASLRTRRHDLAVLRCLGASRRELFLLLLAEGFLLTTAGIIAGLCLAHGGMTLLGQWLGDAQGLNITGWTWAQEEFWLVLGLLSTGIFTAIIPAWQAYQTDVARTLSSP